MDLTVIVGYLIKFCMKLLRSFIQKIRPGPRLIDPFHNEFVFYGEGLLASCPTPKLEDHPLSFVRGCLFNTGEYFTNIILCAGSYRSKLCNACSSKYWYITDDNLLGQSWHRRLGLRLLYLLSYILWLWLYHRLRSCSRLWCHRGGSHRRISTNRGGWCRCSTAACIIFHTSPSRRNGARVNGFVRLIRSAGFTAAMEVRK
jgi:hypothetical protein